MRVAQSAIGDSWANAEGAISTPTAHARTVFLSITLRLLRTKEQRVRDFRRERSLPADNDYRPTATPCARDLSGADGLGVPGVRPFSGKDLHRQAVLFQRNGARRVRVERAGRVVRLVEVEQRRPIIPEVRVEEACGLVRFRAARRVAEYEIEALRPRREGAETQRLPHEREFDDTLGQELVEIAHRVDHFDTPGFRVPDQLAGDAVRHVDREPLEAEERAHLV